MPSIFLLLNIVVNIPGMTLPNVLDLSSVFYFEISVHLEKSYKYNTENIPILRVCIYTHTHTHTHTHTIYRVYSYTLIFNHCAINKTKKSTLVYYYKL